MFKRKWAGEARFIPIGFPIRVDGKQHVSGYIVKKRRHLEKTKQCVLLRKKSEEMRGMPKKSVRCWRGPLPCKF